MDQQGQVLRSGRVPNLQSEIERFLEGLKALEAVIETGRSSYAMMNILETMGVAVNIARETNIFSVKGRKMLLGLDLARDEKRLLEALLKTYRHLETRIEESVALVDKLNEEIREAQLIRTLPGFGKYLQDPSRVGKYMIRPLLPLERLSLDGREGQVGYRYGK